jgi:uncharacterized protein (DUF2249 family)
MTGTTPYDHDPKPLYYRCQAEQAGTFTWTCLEHGPEVWRVRLGRPTGTDGGAIPW